MTQKESGHSGTAQASTPVDTGAKLMAFLNSAFGRLLVVTKELAATPI